MYNDNGYRKFLFQVSSGFPFLTYYGCNLTYVGPISFYTRAGGPEVPLLAVLSYAGGKFLRKDCRFPCLHFAVSSSGMQVRVCGVCTAPPTGMASVPSIGWRYSIMLPRRLREVTEIPGHLSSRRHDI